MSQARRRQYYNITTGDRGLGKETFFEFKYIPSYTRTTRLGKRKNLEPQKSGIETVGKIGLGVAAFFFAVSVGGFAIGMKLLRWSPPLFAMTQRYWGFARGLISN